MKTVAACTAAILHRRKVVNLKSYYHSSKAADATTITRGEGRGEGGVRPENNNNVDPRAIHACGQVEPGVGRAGRRGR